MSSETNFWSPRLIFVNRDSSLVSMECSFVSEPATWYPDARSHFRLHGHKLRDRGQQNTGPSSSPRCRIYGAEFGTFGALSGSSLQTYQTPHRRFYEARKNRSQSIWMATMMEKLFSIWFFTLHYSNFVTTPNQSSTASINKVISKFHFWRTSLQSITRRIIIHLVDCLVPFWSHPLDCFISYKNVSLPRINHCLPKLQHPVHSSITRTTARQL